jgi:hypothetical protein
MNRRGPLLLPGPDGVHADAVAQQRAAALAPAGVDADHGDAQRVALVQAQAADQLVGQAALAGAAGAGDAQHHRRAPAGRRPRSAAFRRRVGLAVLQRGDGLGQRAPGGLGVALQRGQRGRRMRRQVLVAAHHHLADHARPGPCAGRPRGCRCGHAVGLQLADLGRHDHAAAAAEHLDVRAAALAQQVDHVLEVLDVAALVAADGDALHVLLQRGGDDLVDRAVVAQVDDLGAHALQDAPHDVDGRVVAVEQAGGGDEAHLVRRAVAGQGLEGRSSADRSVIEQMELWDVEPRWVVPAAHEAGVSNGYDHPHRLGADRWVALVGRAPSCAAAPAVRRGRRWW